MPIRLKTMTIVFGICFIHATSSLVSAHDDLPVKLGTIQIAAEIDKREFLTIHWKQTPVAEDFTDFVLKSPHISKSYIAAQVEDGCVWFVTESIESDSPASFEVWGHRKVVAASSDEFSIEDNQRDLTVNTRGKPILTYNYAIDQPPRAANPLYQRSGYLHPLYTPQGHILTDDFPPDHLHQHAIFTAWVKTTFRGRNVDFWNQAKGQGTVRHHALRTSTTKGNFAHLATRLQHVAFIDDQEEVVLHENWDLLITRISDAYVLDFFSRQENVTDAPLVVKQYHYGGFGIRGRRDWSAVVEDLFLTSAGQTRIEGNHTRPRWVAMSGPVDQQQPASGTLAVISGRNRFDPQPVRLHPRMPYFCFAPCVHDQFEITKQAPLKSAYRLVMFDGESDPQRIDSLATDFLQANDIEFNSPIDE